MESQRVKSKAIVLCLTALVVACDDDKANIPPSVSVENIEVLERSEVSLPAQAEDLDGSIASYLWQQVSGQAVVIKDSQAATLQFTAPEVIQDETLSFKVSVTDNSGAATSAETKVTVTSNRLLLNLDGRVTMGDPSVPPPFANAEVTATVCGETLLTKATDNGSYSLAIDLDDSCKNSAVHLQAISATDSRFKLVSQLESFEDLLSYAGADYTLTTAEFFGLNISPMSTSIETLMKNANQGLPIEDGETVLALQNSYNAQHILPFAAAIDLVVNHSDSLMELGLPQGVTDSHELLINQAIAIDYVRNARVTTPELIEQSLTKMLLSEDLTPSPKGYTYLPIKGTYYLDKSIEVDVLFSDKIDGSKLTFHDTDGFHTGTSDGVSRFDYRVEADKVILNYQDPMNIDYACDEVGCYEMWLVGLDIQWLANTINSAQLSITPHKVKQYENTAVPDEDIVTTPISLQATKSRGLVNAESVLQIGQGYSFLYPSMSGSSIKIPNDVELPEYYGEINNFLSDITLLDEHTGIAIGETVAIDGKVTQFEQVVEYSHRQDGKLALAIDDFGLTYSMLSDTTPLKVQMEGIGLSINNIVLSQTDKLFTEEDFIGIFQSDIKASIFSNKISWVEFNQDGTVDSFFAYDTDEDGQFEIVYSSQGLWKLNGDRNLTNRFYYQGDGKSCIPKNWETNLTHDCKLLIENVMTMPNIVGDTYYMQQTIKSFNRFPESDLGDGFAHYAEKYNYLIEEYLKTHVTWQKLDKRPIEVSTTIQKASAEMLTSSFAIPKSHTP